MLQINPLHSESLPATAAHMAVRDVPGLKLLLTISRASKSQSHSHIHAPELFSTLLRDS